MLLGVFSRERLLAKQVVGHHIGCSACNLLPVFARIQPGVVVAGLAHIVIAPDLGLTQENRIGDHGRIGQMVAVANDVLHDRSLITLGSTVPPQPALFEMRRVDDQRIAHELTC